MSDSKNEIAWKRLFTKHKILEKINKNGFFEISSTQINEFREARLMTKFDYTSQLPNLFTINNLSLLPISRGSYIISQLETFHVFEECTNPIIRVPIPTHYESIDFKNITSEATAINCAYILELFHSFLGEEELIPTVNGRMGSSKFCFNVKRKRFSPMQVCVNNSQVEIDGGFEGNTSLSLIEAKNSISKDFLIRQLYYPFRLWSSKVKKKVRNVFLTYTNGTFYIREYDFQSAEEYNSIVLLQEQRFILQDEFLTIQTIEKILFEPVVEEPNVPFPQADSFERIINLCELVFNSEQLSLDDITENYDFNKRQTDYYFNAGKYLGLLDKVTDDLGNIYCVLTKKGENLMEKNLIERQIEFIRLILNHRVFNEVTRRYIENGYPPERDEIIRIMKNSNLFGLISEVTFNRRASTVISWVNWILGLVEE